MSNNSEKLKTPEIQDVNIETTTRSPSGTDRHKSFITKITLFIALIALIIALYTSWLNQGLQAQLVDKNQQLNQKIEHILRTQSKTQEEIEIRNTHLENTHTSMLAQFENLNKQVQTAMSQRFYQNQNWLLFKVRYYLELAQINAHWSTNYNATIALLQQADQLLQQFHEPKVFAIRQALAKDIAQVQAIPTVDVAGILSQLDALQNSISELNIPETLTTQSKATISNTQTNTPIWKLRFEDSMSLLSKLIIIRRNDEQITPLISPAFEAILKEKIRLNIQEAQWAVLNNNQPVYLLLLEQAITTLKKNFNENAQNTAALIKTLNTLKEVQFTQKKPIVDSALPLLNKLIETKEPIVTQPNTGVQTGDLK